MLTIELWQALVFTSIVSLLSLAIGVAAGKEMRQRRERLYQSRRWTQRLKFPTPTWSDIGSWKRLD